MRPTLVQKFKNLTQDLRGELISNTYVKKLQNIKKQKKRKLNHYIFILQMTYNKLKWEN